MAGQGAAHQTAESAAIVAVLTLRTSTFQHYEILFGLNPIYSMFSPWAGRVSRTVFVHLLHMSSFKFLKSGL